MARNLNRINNYWQRLAAWEDWAYVATKALQHGYPLLVLACWPPADASVRVIDAAIGAVRRMFDWPHVYEMRHTEWLTVPAA